MPQIEEKLSKFKAAVFADAQSEYDKLMAEIKAKQEKELDESEDEILDSVRNYVHDTVAEMRNAPNLKLGAIEAENTRLLLKKRDQMTKNVFDLVLEKLNSFTQSEEYSLFLCSVLQKLKAVTGDKIIIYVKESDIVKMSSYFMAISPDAEIKADKTIVYGGLKILDSEKNIFIDESLDTRLLAQYTYFQEMSELFLD